MNNQIQFTELKKRLNGKQAKVARIASVTRKDVSMFLDGKFNGKMEIYQNIYYRCCEIAGIKAVD